MTTEPRRIHALRVENVLGIEHVELEPKPAGVTVIAGSNGSGKSSLLAAVELLIEYRVASQKIAEPLRRGTEKGWTEIDCGDFLARRTFTENGTHLTIERKSTGDIVRSPQTFLETIAPPDLLDPMAFASLHPHARRSLMIRAAGLGDLLGIAEAEVRTAEELRTEAGRESKAKLAVLEAIPTVTRVEPVEISRLVEELEDLETKRREIDELEATVREAKRIADDLELDVRDLRERLHKREEQMATARRSLLGLTASLGTLRDERLPAQLKTIREELLGAETTNKQAERWRQREVAVEAYYTADKGKTAAEQAVLDARRRRDALVLEAKFPVEGLGFDDDDATFRGIPWQNLSTSEKIRIGLELGIAQNPGLAVFLIHRGESLDENSLAAVERFTQERGVQVLVECVRGEGHDGAFVLEAGRAASESKP